MKQGAALGKRILLVDDEPAVRSAIRMLLTLDNHAVIEAGNGREALKVFEPERFDLVITDWVMPQMKGDQLALAIQKREPQRPVIMITAFAEDLSTPAGVNVLLRKPFSLVDLRRAVNDCCAADPPEPGSVQ